MKHPITKEEVTSDLRLERAMKAAMASPEHMKLWLQESGRRWLVFDALELIDALPWPGGVQEIMDLISIYTNQRHKMTSGRMEKQEVMNQVVDVPIFKSARLELPELDRVIRFLVAQAVKWDPSWSLEKPAL